MNKSSWSRDLRHSWNATSTTQFTISTLKMSPCLTPRWIWICELPLTEVIWLTYNRNDDVIYASGSPLKRSAHINAGWSNTLCISILSIHSGNLNSWWCSFATSVHNNASSIRMSEVNPCWSNDCRWNKWLEMLLYTNLAYCLFSSDIFVIHRLVQFLLAARSQRKQHCS